MFSLATAARLPRKTTSLPPTGEQTRWWQYKTDSQSTTIACRVRHLYRLWSMQSYQRKPKGRDFHKNKSGARVGSSLSLGVQWLPLKPLPPFREGELFCCCLSKRRLALFHSSPFLSVVNGHCVGWIPFHDGNDRSDYVKKAETPLTRHYSQTAICFGRVA